MTLKIIAGKPGTGKTYHMMSIVADQLTDWVRYEMKHDEPFGSSVWSNIVINMDGLNKTISKRIGKDIDVTKYINVVDDDFFHDENCVYWWKKFPDASLIVIDEVHHYLGKDTEYGSLDTEKELINFLSTHRHSQQEMYFLTQHPDQFASQILGIAETLLEIVNVKSLHLPFPISIPMSDLDELKRAFGIKSQYYQANIGTYRGKALKWNGATTRHLMSDDIFRVYQSHDQSNVTTDRPSLDMTPIESIIWFARRHAWHLVPKLAGACSLPFIVIGLVTSLPSILAEAATKPDSAPKTEQKTAVAALPLPSVPADPQMIHEKTELEKRLAETEKRLEQAETARSGESEIVMLFPDGVLLRNGKKHMIGEKFEVGGNEETLDCVNVRCGIVLFASGKKITF